MRLIATEEAFSIPEIASELSKVANLDEGASLDLPLVRGIYGNQRYAKNFLPHLLDLEEERLRVMDENGVDMHLLSLTAPGVQMFETDTAVGLAELANDRLAETVRRHPTRFAGLGSFAPQDPKRAAREIERVRTTLGLHGLVVNSHTNNEYYDDEKYWPIFEARRGARRRDLHPPARAVRPAGRPVPQIWHGRGDVGLRDRGFHALPAADHVGPVRSFPQAEDRHRPHGRGHSLLAVADRLYVGRPDRARRHQYSAEAVRLFQAQLRDHHQRAGEPISRWIIR